MRHENVVAGYLQTITRLRNTQTIRLMTTARLARHLGLTVRTVRNHLVSGSPPDTWLAGKRKKPLWHAMRDPSDHQPIMAQIWEDPLVITVPDMAQRFGVSAEDLLRICRQNDISPDYLVMRNDSTVRWAWLTSCHDRHRLQQWA